MKIGWDRKMTAVLKHEIIPPTDIAVDPWILSQLELKDEIDNGIDRRRNLAQVARETYWFQQMESDRLFRVMIFDAL